MTKQHSLNDIWFVFLRDVSIWYDRCHILPISFRTKGKMKILMFLLVCSAPLVRQIAFKENHFVLLPQQRFLIGRNLKLQSAWTTFNITFFLFLCRFDLYAWNLRREFNTETPAGKRERLSDWQIGSQKVRDNYIYHRDAKAITSGFFYHCPVN